MFDQDFEYKKSVWTKDAIQRACKHCEYWDSATGECLEGINRALCDCQFSRYLIIDEMFPDEDLDDED